jgi:hypothetical protein
LADRDDRQRSGCEIYVARSTLAKFVGFSDGPAATVTSRTIAAQMEIHQPRGCWAGRQWQVTFRCRQNPYLGFECSVEHHAARGRERSGPDCSLTDHTMLAVLASHAVNVRMLVPPCGGYMESVAPT